MSAQSAIALSATLSASLARLLRPPVDRAEPTEPLRLRPLRGAPFFFADPAASFFLVVVFLFAFFVVAPPFRLREAEEEEEEAELSEWYEWAASEDADDEESYGLW